MAVNQYLQSAAAQLESAANALRLEIDRVRGDFMSFEQQASREITSMEGDMRANFAQSATGQTPPEVAYNAAQAEQLRRKIADLKKEVQQRQVQMTNDIKNKEDAMSGLMSQARSLQGQAGSFK
jgi:hypothetical protein